MVGLLRGEAVTVIRPTVTYDERKDPVTEWAEESLDNVLFDSPTTADVAGAMREFGVRCDYKLHIPKTYDKSLRDCLIRRERDGRVWKVAGDPQPLAWSPLDWDREALVGWVDG